MALKFDLTTEEGRLEFVTHTWPGTAGLAYAGYKAYNRGAVVFAPGHDRPMYVPLAGNNFGNDMIVQSVKDYDPEREIVVVFFLYHTPVVYGKYAVASLPPAKAYQLFMRML
jgi:hypothetical protein